MAVTLLLVYVFLMISGLGCFCAGITYEIFFRKRD